MFKMKRFLKSFLIFSIFAVAKLVVGYSRNEGFYFDNGLGQTEVHVLDLEEQELLREEILTLLGLTHAPRNKAHRVDLNNLGNDTIPHFMLDIYKSITHSASWSGELKAEFPFEELARNPFKLTKDDIHAINESDIIMSFANRGHQEDLQWTQLFWFDTNEIPNHFEEKVLRAELRLYKGPAHSPTENFEPEGEFIVKCYQLVEGSTGSANLLDSQLLKFKDEGWIILDITKAVSAWQLDYHTNQGLMVEIIRTESNTQLHPVAVGLATNREKHPNKEAFMVAYFKSLDPEFMLNNYRRKKRAAEENLPEEHKAKKRKNRNTSPAHKPRKYSNIDSDFGGNPYRDFYSGRSRFRQCQKRQFRVSFRDLGWQDWIIAPDDYEAYYCSGECSFPLSTHMNATNHAIVQTLVYLMDEESVPKPCCAPVELSGISVLYFDESSNVILKKYRDMVVTSCGCH